MTRILGAVGLLLLTVGLPGCSGDDEAGRDAVADLDRDVDAAVDGVVRDLAAAIDARFESGTTRYTWCGESYAPRGVFRDTAVRFAGPAELTDEDALATVRSTLLADDWSAPDDAAGGILVATKGDLEVRVELGGQVLVTVSNPECLETSDDVAREVNDRKATDVEWEARGDDGS